MSTKSTKPNRRISKTLPLMLATSAAVAGLSACNNDPNADVSTVRDEYKSLEDCKEDWGSSDPCEPQKAPPGSSTLSNTGNTSGGHLYTGRYWGPSYYEGRRETIQRNYLGSKLTGGSANLSDHAVSRSVTRSVSRGGFGSSSRGFSGGG